MNLTTGDAREPDGDDAAMLDLLLSAAHRVSIELEAELMFEHVSVMGLVALRRVSEATSPVTLKALAAMLGASRPAATQLVDRLVRDGLIERSPGQHDLRSRVLLLTEYGAGVTEDAGDARRRCIKSITRTFDDADKASLRQQLDRLDRGADWHRTERLWGLHRRGGGMGGGPRRRPAPHIR